MLLSKAFNKVTSHICFYFSFSIKYHKHFFQKFSCLSVPLKCIIYYINLVFSLLSQGFFPGHLHGNLILALREKYMTYLPRIEKRHVICLSIL